MPFPVPMALTVGKKALNMFNKRQANAATGGSSFAPPKTPMSKNNKVRLAAAFTATLIGTAFLLSILQVFAGTKPGMMESYSVFTLNTSRIGEGLLSNMTSTIESFNFSSTSKRDLEEMGVVEVPAMATFAADERVRVGGAVGLLTGAAGLLPVPTSALLSGVEGALETDISTIATVTPTADVTSAIATITSAPVSISTRDVDSAIDSLTSEAGSAADSAENALSSKAASIESAASSKVSSAQAAASSAVTNALQNAEGNIVKVADEAYHGAIDAMDLESWYTIYISSTCSGEFAYKNGTNATVGAVTGDASVHKVINKCESHSAMNPLSVIRVLFWIGAAFTGIGFVCSIASVVRPGNNKIALATICSLLVAFCCLGLASAVTHGVAIAARNTINGTFAKIDVTAEVGKAVQLAWVTTCLVLISILLWVGVKKWAGAEATSEVKQKSSGLPWTSLGRKRQDRTSGITLGYISPVISAPMPVHDDRRTQQWI
jgi:hypothetical protein